jgi:endonuclease/exonuclease/phosphatase family metal-dependent hydrolase
MGVAILSRFPIKNTSVFPYHAPNGDEIIQFNNKPFDMIRKTTRSSLFTVEVEGETTYRVGTTHFTWTPDGLPNEHQRADANALLKILEQFPDIVVCGDFNMPRGFNDIYTLFTDRFTDVIPQSYISSLDMTYHRVKDDKEQMAVLSGYMVDYVFVSNAYEAKEVKLIQGVSDHCAVSAGVYRKTQ